jgi:hypothetical protein
MVVLRTTYKYGEMGVKNQPFLSIYHQMAYKWHGNKHTKLSTIKKNLPIPSCGQINQYTEITSNI